MALELDGIEGLELTDAQKAAIQAKHDEDVKGLKDNHDKLLEEKKSAAAKAKTAEEEAAAAKLEADKKKGDVDSITKSYEDKIEKMRQENAGLQTQLKDRDAKDAKNAIQVEALKVANELAEGQNVEIMARFASDRLRYEDGKVKVTDADGALTVSTTADLVKEMRDDTRFASLVVATKSSGGGANGGTNNGSGGSGGQSDNKTTQHLAAKVPGFKDLPVR